MCEGASKIEPKTGWVITTMVPKPGYHIELTHPKQELETSVLVQMQMLSCIAWLMYFSPKLVRCIFLVHLAYMKRIPKTGSIVPKLVHH